MTNNDTFTVANGVGEFSTGAEFPRLQFLASLWEGTTLPRGMVVYDSDGKWTVAPYWHKCPKRSACDRWRQFLIGETHTITPTGAYGASVIARRRVKKR